MEAVDGCKMPPSSYIAVRLSETLKQGKYDPTRSYHFPSFKERKRQAKIDIFRLVGSSSVLVSADEVHRTSEVCVSSNDPIINDLRLKVTAKQFAAKKVGITTTVPLKKENVRKQAEQYLEKHRVQEKISSAMQHLLQKQPEDPIDFLCDYLQGLKEPKQIPKHVHVNEATLLPKANPAEVVAPKVSPAYMSVPALAAANNYYRRLRSELDPGNFGAYYSQHVLPAALPPALCSKMYSHFPNPRKGVQPIGTTHAERPHAGAHTANMAANMAATQAYNAATQAYNERLQNAYERMLEIRLASMEQKFAATVDSYVQQRFFNLACSQTLPQEERPFVSAVSEDALNILLQAESMLIGRNAKDLPSEEINSAKTKAKATFLKSLGLDAKDTAPKDVAPKAEEKWNLKPSIGTWLANPMLAQQKSEPPNATLMNLRPSVDTRCTPTRPAPTPKEFLPKQNWCKRPSIGTWLHVR